MSALAKIEAHKRSAWKPVVVEGDDTLVASKFGGTPAVPSGSDWPCCPNCDRPMQLFVQLAAAEMPAGAPSFGGEGLLQLFYCTSSEPLCEDDQEAYAPFSSSVLARIIDPDNAVAPSARPDEPFPARRVTSWEEADDYPNWEELEALGIELTDEESDELIEEYPSPQDKLGGWPLWVQSVEYPDCTQCGARMHLVMQIDSEDNVPYMFGDCGTGHLTQCATHRDVMSFHWACS